MRKVITALILMLPQTANAQSAYEPFRISPQDSNVAVLAGKIEDRSAYAFRRLLRDFPDVKKLYLSSGGGAVQPALVIADDVRSKGISTQIEPEAVCYSACAYIYFAGVSRWSLGKLGVHQMYGSGSEDHVQQNVSDVFDALNNFGVDPRVMTIMLRTGADKMHVFNMDELVLYGINKSAAAAPKSPPLQPSNYPPIPLQRPDLPSHPQLPTPSSPSISISKEDAERRLELLKKLYDRASRQ